MIFSENRYTLFRIMPLRPATSAGARDLSALPSSLLNVALSTTKRLLRNTLD
jgi:hypothetical protein